MRRRRGSSLQEALLEAAWAELTERGYAGFTLEALAKRAGTSTPVLYRRWTDKREIIEAAIAHASATRPVEVPDTGSLRGDLIAIMQATNRARVDLLAAATVHLGSYFDNTGTGPEQLRELALNGRPSAAEIIGRRAADRGEIDPAVLTPRTINLPFDLFRHEVLMTLKPVSDEAIEDIVDTIVMPLLTRPR
ncbi:TetR/AcrR family transcriptional regulator [Microbispora sp. CA-135349]|uniref:TetR/AcrR family transcriptional regulator n=1 Tax=Microbispora sp. CA-135349 TaxID=3239953 RepID=UPI003D8C3773